jgi:hypothetical protein
MNLKGRRITTRNLWIRTSKNCVDIGRKDIEVTIRDRI